MNISVTTKAKCKAIWIVGLLSAFMAVAFIFIPFFSISRLDGMIYRSKSISLYNVWAGTAEKTNFFENLFASNSKNNENPLLLIEFFNLLLPILLIIFALGYMVRLNSFSHKEEVYLSKVMFPINLSFCILLSISAPILLYIFSDRLIGSGGYEVFSWNINYLSTLSPLILLAPPFILCNILVRKPLRELYSAAKERAADIPSIFNEE